MNNMPLLFKFHYLSSLNFYCSQNASELSKGYFTTLMILLVITHKNPKAKNFYVENIC